MFHHKLFISFLLVVLFGNLSAQPFSKQDYLHGKLSKLRSCFDVKTYEITTKVDIEHRFISGKNELLFWL